MLLLLQTTRRRKDVPELRTVTCETPGASRHLSFFLSEGQISSERVPFQPRMALVSGRSLCSLADTVWLLECAGQSYALYFGLEEQHTRRLFFTVLSVLQVVVGRCIFLVIKGGVFSSDAILRNIVSLNCFQRRTLILRSIQARCFTSSRTLGTACGVALNSDKY